MSSALPPLPEVLEVLTLRAGYNTTMVVLGTTMLGLAAGVIGVFALLRKRSLTTDALSHATLPGIALAFLAATALGVDGRSLPVLLLGATATGVLGMVCIQLILRHARLHEDAAIGIVLSVFFGAGVVGLSYIQRNSPSGSASIDELIYGQAATMLPADVYLMGGIALVAIASTVLFLKEFALVSFNDAFARVDGWPVTWIDLLMMGLVVVVTVAGLRAVGLILVIAMLIVPPVSARFWTERLWVLVLVAGLIGALSGYLGSVVSALLPRKPTGAIIVLTSGVIFVVSMLAAPGRGVIAASVRRLGVRLRIACDHFLESAHESGLTELERSDIARIARRQGWHPMLRRLTVWWLARTGMVQRSGAGLCVSSAGSARGARVARNHALWEQYLVSHADIAPSHVDWSVDQVEHVLSEELVALLEEQLEKQHHHAKAGGHT